jgi:hypothetical protein
MIRSLKVFLAVAAILLLVGLTRAALPDDVHAGKLLAAYPDKREIVVSENQTTDGKSFNLADDAKVLINDNPADIMDLRVGENVTVTYEMQIDRPVATEVRVKRQ